MSRYNSAYECKRVEIGVDNEHSEFLELAEQLEEHFADQLVDKAVLRMSTQSSCPFIPVQI